MVLTLPGEIDQRNTYQEVLYDVPMIAAVSEAFAISRKSRLCRFLIYARIR